MAILSPGWYVENEQRAYPLADRALRVDDAGLPFPEDVLADIHVVFPRIMRVPGAAEPVEPRYLFISSYAATPYLVSLTILASTGPLAIDEVPGTPLFIPIASVSLRRPVLPHRNYRLTPYADGVDGWVAFGSGVSRLGPEAYRFSSPAQSRIVSNAARPLSPPSVFAVGKTESSLLVSGVVELRMVGDMEASVAERAIEDVQAPIAVTATDTDAGVDLVFDTAAGMRYRLQFRQAGGETWTSLRRAIIAESASTSVSVADDDPQMIPEGEDAAALEWRAVGVVCRRVIVFQLSKTTDPESFSKYAGSCAQRPEAGTCGRVPIRTINGVPPGCNGNIVLRFLSPIEQTQVDGAAELARLVPAAGDVPGRGPFEADPDAEPDPGAGTTIFLDAAIGFGDICPERAPAAEYSSFDACLPVECGSGGTAAVVPGGTPVEISLLGAKAAPLPAARTTDFSSPDELANWRTSGTWSVR